MKRTLCAVISILTIVIILKWAYAAATDYAAIVEQQLNLERALEVQTEKVLSNIVGPNRASVTIKIEPNVERSQTETETWAEEKSKEAERTKKAEEEEEDKKPFKVKEFLPGIPLKRNLVADEEESIDKGIQERKASGVKKSVESVLKLPSSFIKRITAIIVIDKKVPETLIATVEDVVTDLLAIEPSRGDKLVIKRVDYTPANPWWGFLLKPATYLMLLGLIVIVAMIFFLFGPVKQFLAGLKDTIKELSGVAQATLGAAGGVGGGGMRIAEGEMNVEKKKGEGEGETEEEVALMAFEPFKFIEGKNLKNLLYLIKDESPDRIAVIMSYLDPPKAAQLMQGLAPKVQMEVALAMTRIKETPREIIERIEESIRKKIDNISGGIDRFAEILGMMDGKIREQVLKEMEKESPTLVDKIKKRIFTFDQIGKLEDQALRMILGEVESSLLAIALRDVSKELKEKILKNMSEAGAALLKEEMEFGKPASAQQIEEAQQKVVEIVLNLEKEGRVTIEGRDDIKLLEKEEIYNLSIEEKLRKLSEPVENTDNEKAFEHYNNGIEEFQAGKYKEAIEEFEYSLRYNNKIWQTYQYLGTCYYSQGMEKEAVWAYKKALELNPDNEQLKEWLNQHELKEA